MHWNGPVLKGGENENNKGNIRLCLERCWCLCRRLRRFICRGMCRCLFHDRGVVVGPVKHGGARVVPGWCRGEGD